MGGHMRSHMLNLPIPPKPQVEVEEQVKEEEEEDVNQVSEDAESASSSSSSSEEEEGGEEKGQFYGLRENPKRSIRLGDPEFSFAAVDAGSVILQDRESETESSKNPTRRRSKRTGKSEHHHRRFEENAKKFKSNPPSATKSESWAEPEPVSSISGTTTEEDVAFCLMMLSRDNKWKNRVEEDEDQQRGEAEKSMEETDESYGFKSIKTPNRGKYKCETCKKVFKSYQALGGHRASHKKNKQSNEPQMGQENAAGTCSSTAEKKIHECPVCLRIFSSGQALGGHKRSHGVSLVETPAKSCTSFIDLNLPAPIDDEELSQIELSAVSDAEFVNQMNR